jgi:hypothetical protein
MRDRAWATVRQLDRKEHRRRQAPRQARLREAERLQKRDAIGRGVAKGIRVYLHKRGKKR